MNNRVFLLFALVLVFCIQLSYFAFKSEINNNDQLYAIQLSHLKKEIEKEKARTQVALFQNEVFRQHVATILPSSKLEQKNYEVRSLASVLKESENLDLLNAKYSRTFSEIRSLFLNKQYELAAKEIEKFIRIYPESSEIHEAYFLFASALYELKQYENCLKQIDVMIENFPESELTGFALLMMAEIFIKEERPQDAQSVLDTILKNFKFKEIQDRAKKLLRDIQI